MHVLYQQEQEGYITLLSPFLGFSVSPLFSSLFLNFDCYPLFGGLPWWLRGKRICLQSRRPGFDPWIGTIPWRREWLPTPVFLPGKSHGQRSLGGYSPRGCKESDATGRLAHYWVQLRLFCQWSCWFPASDEKQFSGLPNLFFTPCAVLPAWVQTVGMQLGTQVTHFEKCRKSIYLTFEAPVPPSFLWAGIDNGTLGDPHILPLIWKLSTKSLLLFHFNHLSSFKFYFWFKLTSYLISACDMTILYSAKEGPGEINRNVYLQFQF